MNAGPAGRDRRTPPNEQEKRMSPGDQESALLVRAAEAEQLETMGVWLYADHETTRGRFSANRTFLPAGAEGPPPHFHTGSAELFFVLAGTLRVLAGDEIVDLTANDFLLIPPYMPHAWAATADVPADVLVTFTPGIERFEYFRLGDRIRRGTADPREILDTQDRFDNHFVDSAVWRRDRTGDDRPALDVREHRAEFLSSGVLRRADSRTETNPAQSRGGE
jgi:mannose-6-phosphate isomerase-like protein (cupin superfamily)